MVKFIFFGFDIIKFLSFLDNTYLYVINSLKKVINLFLIRFRTRNRPKNIKIFCFSNPIELRKMTDIIYSFEKLGKWKKLKERLKLIRIYKRNFHDEVVHPFWPVGTNRKWFLIMWWNLSNMNEKPKCLFEAKSLMILLPYLIRWWIRKNLSFSKFSMFSFK